MGLNHQTLAQVCNDAILECGAENPATGECEDVGFFDLTEPCDYTGGRCQTAFADPCEARQGRCLLNVSQSCSCVSNCGPVSTPPPGGGGACGSSSAGQCQGKNQGAPCGDGGTCGNPPNCSCQGQGEDEDLSGCNGSSVICDNRSPNNCPYLTSGKPNNQLYPNACGRDRDDNSIKLYWQCCGCTATNPTAPTLTYPINGQNVDYSSVPLTWSGPTSWGTGCPINENGYLVYVGTTNPPTTVVATTGSSVRTYDFTGVDGTAVYYWQIEATNGVRETKSSVSSFTGNYDPWWQVMDADVLTLGNLISGVPGTLGEGFILDGPGGFPGVAIYGGTVADFSAGGGTGTVSSTGWLGNASTVSQKTYSYDYFESLIPSDIIINEITSTDVDGSLFSSGGIESRGYFWYRFDGTTGVTQNQDLTITSGVNLGSRKVILLVKGANLNIGGDINLLDGAGFFQTIVGKNESGGKGDILIDPDAVSLEGFYFADSNFQTGSAGEDADEQLYVRGAVVAYEGMILERDLANDNTTPAEFFEYGLDQVLLYPPSLSVKKIRWKEVAP